MKYIELSGMSADVNAMANDAIDIRYDCCDAKVNLIHMFIAFTRSKCQAAKKLVEKYKIDSKNIEKAVKIYNDATLNAKDTAIRNYDDTQRYDDFDAQYDIGEDLLVLMQHLHNIALAKGSNDSPYVVSAKDFLDKLFEAISWNDDLKKFVEDCGVKTAGTLATLKPLDIPRALVPFIDDITTLEYVLESKIDGVDEYANKAFEILSRKKKANPCFIGNAGVGKTSIVHRMAQKIVSGDVPEMFKNTHILAINGATITAGTKYRGDFEDRMQKIVEFIKENEAVLFVDEIHTFVNSGKSSEDSDTAGDMIKTELADGRVKIIGTTTIKDYHASIETDTALKRRLQCIEVKEPSNAVAIKMIKNTISDYEEYHGVKVPDSLIELTVELSARYLKDQYLPDKAYTILDDACAKTKIAGKKTLSEKTIYRIVSDMSGVDVTNVTKSESKQLLNLEKTLNKSVIGQDEAIGRVARAIRRSKAGTREENKPVASFLFVGPTGVGKTELCKTICDTLLPGRESFIKIDMSEYSEKYSASKLIGSAPGYVGYGEGGQLTEKVKHNPYSLVLFDEIEKADPSIFNSLLQLLDEGRLTDSHGDTVDFTNCIIVMTSNAGYGAELLGKKTLGFGSIASNENEQDKKDATVKKALEETFKPEFINRIDDIVVFNKLTKDNCRNITKLLLDKLVQRVKTSSKATIEFSDEVIDEVNNRGYSDRYGARALKRKIQDFVEDTLSIYILDGTIKANGEYSINYDKLSDKITVSDKNMSIKFSKLEDKSEVPLKL